MQNGYHTATLKLLLKAVLLDGQRHVQLNARQLQPSVLAYRLVLELQAMPYSCLGCLTFHLYQL